MSSNVPIVPVEIAINRAHGAPLATFANAHVLKNGQAFWINNDMTAAHQPAPDGGADDAWSPEPIAQAPGGGQQPFGSDAVRFTTPGSYPYHCVIHPAEKGTVVVP